MKKELTLEDAEGNPVAVSLQTNGMTSVIYSAIFHKDLLNEIYSMGKDHFDGDLIKRLAFIMAKTAEAKSMDDYLNMNKLTNADFYTWLINFSSFTFESHAQEILDVYMTGRAATSTQKKRSSRRTAK